MEGFKKVKWEWKLPSLYSVDAQTAGEELERIKTKYGHITAAKVVEESRRPGSTLHECFEWDDTFAAEKYREAQARTLIRNITFRVEEVHMEPVGCVSTTLLFGDCLRRMKEIPDGSVDMVLADLPFGVINRGNPNAANDQLIPLGPLWEQYKRVCKKHGAIVLFGSGMFTAQLMMSQPKLWRYNLVWDKVRSTGFLNANRMPLRGHEDILVFYRALPEYHPQMEDLNGREPNHEQGHGDHNEKNGVYGSFNRINPTYEDKKHPRSIVRFNAVHCNEDQCHPNQKPVKLLEWLIRSYTSPGDTVLDNAMGSGSTGVAAVNTGRDFIGIEINKEYYAAAAGRIGKAETAKKMEDTYEQLAVQYS